MQYFPFITESHLSWSPLPANKSCCAWRCHTLPEFNSFGRMGLTVVSFHFSSYSAARMSGLCISAFSRKISRSLFICEFAKMPSIISRMFDLKPKHIHSKLRKRTLGSNPYLFFTFFWSGLRLLFSEFVWNFALNILILPFALILRFSKEYGCNALTIRSFFLF